MGRGRGVEGGGRREGGRANGGVNTLNTKK